MLFFFKSLCFFSWFQLGRKNCVLVKDASSRRCPFAWRLRRDCSGDNIKSRKQICMISFFFFFLGRDLWSRFFSVFVRVVDTSRFCEREWVFLVAGLLWRWSEKCNANFLLCRDDVAVASLSDHQPPRYLRKKKLFSVFFGLYFSRSLFSSRGSLCLKKFSRRTISVVSICGESSEECRCKRVVNRPWVGT